jgi:hypothetical protein
VHHVLKGTHHNLFVDGSMVIVVSGLAKQCGTESVRQIKPHGASLGSPNAHSVALSSVSTANQPFSMGGKPTDNPTDYQSALIAARVC